MDDNCDDRCYAEPVTKAVSHVERRNTSTALLAVMGMGCPNCAIRVRNGLVSLDGVADAEVDHLAGTAQVAYDPDRTSTNALVRAVAQAGNDGRHCYGARLIETAGPAVAPAP